MPFNIIDHKVLPTQTLAREAEDFCQSDKYHKHLLLPTYLAYLQPEGIISTSYWFLTHFLMAPYIVSSFYYPLGHRTF